MHGRSQTQSPAAVVAAYAQSQRGGFLFHRENEIFRKMALEAIRNRPRDYLKLSLRGIGYLWNNGLSFWYPWQLLAFNPPASTVDASWAKGRVEGFQHWSALSHGRWSAGFEKDRAKRFDSASPTVALPSRLTIAMTRWFRVIVSCGVFFGLIAVLAVKETARIGQRLMGLLPCAAVAVLYVVFCGFTIPAEPPRYFAHVQDLVVAIPLILIGVGVGVLCEIARSLEPERDPQT